MESANLTETAGRVVIIPYFTASPAQETAASSNANSIQKGNTDVAHFHNKVELCKGGRDGVDSTPLTRLIQSKLKIA